MNVLGNSKSQMRKIIIEDLVIAQYILGNQREKIDTYRKSRMQKVECDVGNLNMPGELQSTTWIESIHLATADNNTMMSAVTRYKVANEIYPCHLKVSP